jgi:PHD/YefM family antitoxin component YafN of YafNO toxin-antitoxin module
MATVRERYVVDEHGKRVSVLLDIAEYRRLLEELEELEAIRAFDRAEASGEKPVPFGQVVKEIEAKRR